MKKQVLIFLFDGYSDWEISYITPELCKRTEYEVIYFSINGKPVVSMGGLNVLPGKSINDIDANAAEMLILPGGYAWEKGELPEVDDLIMTMATNGKTIAAICGATIRLAQLGLLDSVKHTSNVLFYLKQMATNYKGDENYVEAEAVADQNIITAGGIYPIDFAKAILTKLDPTDESSVNKWFQLFKHGVWVE